MENKLFELVLNSMKAKTNDNFKIHFEVKNNKLEVDFQAGKIDTAVIVTEYIDHLIDEENVNEDKIIELFYIILTMLDIKYNNFSNKLKNKLK